MGVHSNSTLPLLILDGKYQDDISAVSVDYAMHSPASFIAGKKLDAKVVEASLCS